MPVRCVRAPPPYTWASGVSSSLPRGSEHHALRTHPCAHPTRPRRTHVPLTWSEPLFPSGRQALTQGGPRLPVPVAIPAAGQGFGGSDVLSGQKKPATSQVLRAEVTSAVVGRATSGPSPEARGAWRGATSGAGPRRAAGAEVTSSARPRRDGAADAAAAAATEELARLPVGLQSDDGALLPALRAQPAPPSPGRRRGVLSAQLCREADPLQPPPHGRLRAPHARAGAAPHRRLRGCVGGATCDCRTAESLTIGQLSHPQLREGRCLDGPFVHSGLGDICPERN